MATNSYGWASPTGQTGGTTGGRTQSLYPQGQQQSVSTAGGTLQYQQAGQPTNRQSTMSQVGGQSPYGGYNDRWGTPPQQDRWGGQQQPTTQYPQQYQYTPTQQTQFNAQQYQYTPPQQMLQSPYGQGPYGGGQQQQQGGYNPAGYGQNFNLGQFGMNPDLPTYFDKDAREASLAHSQAYFQPALNAYQQSQDRDMADRQFAASFQRQTGLDLHTMSMDQRRQALEEAGFNFSTGQFQANFQENQRQFNEGMGYNYANMNTQANVAYRGQDVDRHGIDTRANVDMRGQDVQQNIAYRGQDVDRYGIDTRAGVDVRGQDVQERLGNLQYGTQRYGIDVDAATQRARMENDLTQSRYATFGRAQAPNFRTMGGWR